MMEELRRAISTGEVLEVWYFGGSNPGTVRKIAPVKIIDDQVRAHCFEDDAIKSYSISKMELYIPGAEPKLKVSRALIPQEIASISEMLNYSKDTLEGLGWVVTATEKEISLHQKFKNGKPKKTPTVSVVFEEFEYKFPEPDTSSSEFDWDDFIPEIVEGDAMKNAEKVPRERPWVVRAKSKNAISYGVPNRAFTKFIEWANEQAPTNEI